MGNIASVSWGDHLVFGEGDGRLHTPEAVERRMAAWREELGAESLHWRVPHSHIPGCYHKAPDYPDTIPSRSRASWDFLSLVPQLAHRQGLKAWLYVSLFDEGFPLAPPEVRAVSYHNAMHGQHITWQSDFSRTNPEYALVDRSGQQRQWGVLCLAYPQVRAHFVARFRTWLTAGEWDGLFVCLRSQSRPADFADQFGFNPPVREDFLARYGRDILRQDFDLQAWRDLRGEYLTRMLVELRALSDELGVRLGVGAPRGDVLGPPLDNRTLNWREWVRRGLVDELVINQNSSRCPSMWHDLWPMHRGYGYLQNYLDGHNLPPLETQVKDEYAALFAADGVGARLFIARQWDERDAAVEGRLLALPAVSGLVFSTFRHDNPAAVARGDWRA